METSRTDSLKQCTISNDEVKGNKLPIFSPLKANSASEELKYGNSDCPLLSNVCVGWVGRDWEIMIHFFHTREQVVSPLPDMGTLSQVF